MTTTRPDYAAGAKVLADNDGIEILPWHEELSRAVIDAALTRRDHTPGNPCPIVGGEPITFAFTDHDLPGVYNACVNCHPDTRDIHQRLQDLKGGTD